MVMTSPSIYVLLNLTSLKSGARVEADAAFLTALSLMLNITCDENMMITNQVSRYHLRRLHGMKTMYSTGSLPFLSLGITWG
jgi:hypothetical protein